MNRHEYVGSFNKPTFDAKAEKLTGLTNVNSPGHESELKHDLSTIKVPADNHSAMARCGLHSPVPIARSFQGTSNAWKTSDHRGHLLRACCAHGDRLEKFVAGRSSQPAPSAFSTITTCVPGITPGDLWSGFPLHAEGLRRIARHTRTPKDNHKRRSEFGTGNSVRKSIRSRFRRDCRDISQHDRSKERAEFPTRGEFDFRSCFSAWCRRLASRCRSLPGGRGLRTGTGPRNGDRHQSICSWFETGLL